MSTSYSPQIITDGLVLYLDAANSKSYNQSENILSNLNATNLTVQFFNGALYSPDGKGVFKFDPFFSDFQIISDDYLQILTDPIFNLGNSNFTLEMNVTTCDRILFGQYQDGLRAYMLNCLNGAVTFSASSDGSSWNILNSDLIVQNAVGWISISVTRNGGAWSMYKNGKLESTHTASGTIYNAEDNVLVYKKIDNTFAAIGALSSIKLYNRSLSAEQILQNYNSTKGRFENYVFGVINNVDQ